MCKLPKKHLALVLKRCIYGMYNVSQKKKCSTCNRGNQNEKKHGTPYKYNTLYKKYFHFYTFRVQTFNS